MQASELTIECLRGQSAGRSVLLGFAPADVLHALSFADVLDEETGRGYQRRFNPQHSLDFRRYIQKSESTTIPLTFNLRPQSDKSWRLIERAGSRVTLHISSSAKKVLSQVDCQHRLGHLHDLRTTLPFMFFIELTEREEMEIFNVINSKAKGLSSSLLDFHDAQLSADLGAERPELFVALSLKNDPRSPWYQQLDLGGSSTSGMARRASLRTLQKAIKRFIARTESASKRPIDEVAQVVMDFWGAVSIALPQQWANPRRHLLTKGIGVYALMDIAADIYLESGDPHACDKRFFSAVLADFAPDFDWSSEGPLKGLGGESGVKSAVTLLRDARRKTRLKVVARG